MDERAFGEHLVESGVISARQLSQARETQAVVAGRLDTVLLGMGAVAESSLLKALGSFLKARTASGVEIATADPEVLRMLSPRVARRFRVVPFRKEGNRLSIASPLPLDLLVEDELALLTGCMVSSFVALEIRVLESLTAFAELELPWQLTNVLKKLRGEGADHPSPPRAAAAPASIATAAPAAAPAPAATAAAAPTTAQPAPVARRRPAEPSELEIDEDDLALFPSLRAALAEEAPIAAPEPPPIPAEATVPPPIPGPPPPPPPRRELGPEDRLAAAADSLQGAEMRDDIADAVLDFCAPWLRRRMLLVVRKDAVVGWRGEGEGVDETAVRAISIPLHEPSVFVGLNQGTSFWLGALPPMPHNLDLVLGLGGERPRDCVILPVAVKSKIVCFLYGDNMEDGVAGVPMALLKRLIAKASLAFQVYLLKSKIRLL